MQLIGNIYFLLLIFSTILIILLLMYQHKKKSVQQLRRLFTFSLICVLIICVGVLVQSIFSTCFDINPIYFENFIYIGSCFLPVALFFTALSFKNTIIKFKKIYLLLFIVPITTLIVLFTNNLHHAFYVHYSENLNEMVYGWYLNVHIIYTYGLMLLSVIIIIKSSFKISGFFSKQSLLIILGISVPLITNILGTLKIIPMTVYITPISFAFTMLCFTFAIFKFNFLGVAPIALQTIVNRISDSYLVLDENFLITDFNTTFLKTFGLTASELREQNVINFLKTHKKYEIRQKP